jgi:hypothetical protein
VKIDGGCQLSLGCFGSQIAYAPLYALEVQQCRFVEITFFADFVGNCEVAMRLYGKGWRS